MSHNVRTGLDHKMPESGVLRALVKRSPMQAEVFELCDRLCVSRHLFEGWGDDELRGLTLEICRSSLGIPSPQACQLVAKVNGVALREAEGKREVGHETARARLRELLLGMLRRDDELRLSVEIQERYAMEPESWDWKWQVTDDVQQQVCREFGFADSIAEGLDLLRSSRALFPRDQEILQAAHYLRYNIHVECPVPVGELTPDIQLFDLTGAERRLGEVVAADKGTSATVLLAGSHT